MPSRIIKALARAWAAVPTSTVHANGGNMSRAPYATENMRLEVCLLGMQGLGKPGRHMWTTIEWGLFGDLDPAGPSGPPSARQSVPVPRTPSIRTSVAGQPRRRP